MTPVVARNTMPVRSGHLHASASLAAYMKDIGRIAPLTRSEELDLFCRLATGDVSARARLLEGSLPWVAKAAWSYRRRGLPLEDLIQEGMIGLMDVLDKFKPSVGVRFSTYALFWVHHSMQRALRQQLPMVKLPVRKARMLDRLREKLNRDQLLGQITPDERVAEAATEHGLEPGDVRRWMELREPTASLDALMDEAESPSRLLPLSREAARRAIEQRHTARNVRRALDVLDERERTILMLRFGLDGQDVGTEGRSLRQTSRLVGLSQEWVRVIEQRALSKLRALPRLCGSLAC